MGRKLLPGPACRPVLRFFAVCRQHARGFLVGFRNSGGFFLVENLSQLSSAAVWQGEKDSVSSPGVSLTQACRSGLWPDLKASGVCGGPTARAGPAKPALQYKNTENPENP